MADDPFLHTMPYQVWNGAFTPAELDAIEAYGDRLPQSWGTVLSDGPEMTYDTLRVARTAAMPPTPEIAWLYERLERVIRVFNHRTYQFDLSGFSEPFQYMVYHGSDGGHFHWHVDNGKLPAPRKLSASLQLTDGALYEGCDLEINGSHQIETAPRTRGSLVLFPSYVLHRVTPIRSGTRKALVIWATGPRFR